MKHLIPYLFLGLCPLTAAVKPAEIFTDGTVLQQNEPVRIWGTADPGEKINIQFAGKSAVTQTAKDGKWMVTLQKMPASSTPQKLTISSADKSEVVSLKNVLVGEVWLAGGQSNMASTMQTYRKKSQPDIDSANDPLLRMITIPKLEYAGQKRPAAKWLESTPVNAAQFSASAYYFAKHLRKTLDVPVGIISCSVGATPAEAWMSREKLSSKPDLKRIIDAYDQHVKTAYINEDDYLNKIKAYKKTMADFNRFKKDKAKRPKKPAEVMGSRNFKRPCGLYENMLTKTIPYTIKGVIWYQGENNANAKAGLHYRSVFSSLIEEWRSDFKNDKLPFLYVQLATLGWGTGNYYWPELRDSQRWVELNVPNTGMVVIVDGGEKNNIHPHSKDIVGLRLSLLARNMVYGENDLICRGPSMVSAKAEGSSITLTFKNTGRGLVLKPTEPDFTPAFELCGDDGKYVPATATLQNGNIVVAAKNVPNPKYIRYGWNRWFEPTLFNKDGLPASPFRTDHFPMQSKGHYFLDWLKPAKVKMK